MTLFRYAVVQLGDEWKVLSERRRIGAFPTRQLAMQAGARLAREAAASGREVELLVQGASGELMSFDVLAIAGHFDELQGGAATPADDSAPPAWSRTLEL
jgi:hypothetical protein